MIFRKVAETVTGRATVDGAGVHLTRVLSRRTAEKFDPFLMLDAFDSTNPDDYTKGFPLHPHRGIETVTYLIEGEIEHMDSIGNKGVITSGSCQWMTAGRGILHQEMPKASPRMLGLQLWVNLSKKNKMTEPAYRDITPELVTKVSEDSADVAIVAGEYNGHHGGIKGEHLAVTFLDITLKPGKTWVLDTNAEDNVVVYTILGKCSFGGSDEYAAKQAILFTEGNKLKVSTDDGARFVVFYGKPLKEPITWGGPIVMNTEEELQQAFDELEKGTFIKAG